MKNINLKNHYPNYKSDYFIKVGDETYLLLKSLAKKRTRKL